MVGWVPQLAEWQESTESRDGPSAVPLLASTSLKRQEIGAWNLATSGQAALKGPSEPGRYRYWMVGEEGRIFWLEAGVEPDSRWEADAPKGVRAGDAFQAGPRFSPGLLKGVIGLTASADEGLAPEGYLSTAGVSKGTQVTLPFSYSARIEAQSALALGWKVARGGFRRTVEAKVDLWETPLVTRRLRTGELVGSHRLRADGPWRLVIWPPEEGTSLIAATDPTGRRVERRLTPSSASLVFEGAVAGVVHVVQSGDQVGFDWYRTEPDQGQVKTWASAVYLERGLRDEDGDPTLVWNQSAPGKILLSLVNPYPHLTGKLELPIPAGLEPVSLDSANALGGATEWTYDKGVVRLPLKELQVGEYLWEIELVARSTGEYLWPSARVYSSKGEVWAISSSSRIKVEAK